jgi:hypothetical protein
MLKIEALPPINKNDTITLNKNAHCIPKHPARVLFNGSSGSGKSNLIITMLTKPEFYLNYFDFVFILSPNFDRDDSYRHIDKLIAKQEKTKKGTIFQISEKFDEEEMGIIIQELAQSVEKLPKAKRKKVLFLLDDILEDKKLLNSSFLSLLFTRGRHLNTSIWFSTQSYKNTPRKLRLQLSDIILFEPRNLSEKKMIYEEFSAGLPPDMFDAVVNMVFSKPFRFLVIRPNETNKKKKLSLCFEHWIEF